MARCRTRPITSVRMWVGVLVAVLGIGALPGVAATAPAAAAPEPLSADVQVVPVTGAAGLVGSVIPQTSAHGLVTWQQTSRWSAFAQPAGSGTWSRLSPELDACDSARWTRDRYVACQVMGPVRDTVLRLDLRTGEVQRTFLPRMSWPAFDADSALQVSGSRVLRHRGENAPEVASDFGGSPWSLRGVVADETGFVVRATNAAGEWHVLLPDHTDLGVAPSALSLRGDRIAVVDGADVVVRSRVDGSELGRVATGGYSSNLTLGQDGVAWVDPSNRLLAAPVAPDGRVSAPTVRATALDKPVLTAAPGGGVLLAVRGASSLTRYPFTGSSTSIRLSNAPRRAVGVAVGGNQLAVMDDRTYVESQSFGHPGRYEVTRRTLSGTSGAPVVGAETTLSAPRADWITASGARLLLSEYTGAVTRLYDRGVLRRSPAPSPAWASERMPVLGGSTVLVGDHAELADGSIRQAVGSGVSPWATDGRRVVWSRPGDGVTLVRRLDLPAGTSNPSVVADLIAPRQLAVSDDVVASVVGDRLSLSRLDGTPLRTVSASASRNHAPVFGDGFLAWLAPLWGGGSGPYRVYVLDLRDDASTPVLVGEVPDVRVAAPASLLSGEGDTLAWIGGDGDVRVARISQPRSEGWSVRGLPVQSVGLSPNGDRVKDTWSLEVDLDRPVGTAVVVVRNSAGQEVRRLAAATPDGAVRVTWDGRTASGAVAPDGRYTWSLTTPTATGPAQPTPAGAVPTTTGSIVLARSAPAPRVSVPLLTSDRTAVAGAVVVGWTSASSPASLVYDVQTRSVTRDSAGTLRYGPWSTDASSLRTRSTTVRLGWARTVWSYDVQVRVRARDTIGNTSPWSTSGNVALPFDDYGVGSGVEQTGTWTAIRDAAAYAGSYRRTSSARASYGMQHFGGTWSFVGRRCPACGKALVVVDGKALTTIDTRGTASHRTVLARVRLSPGWHHVRVVNQATSGRPWLMVDGLGVTY